MKSEPEKKHVTKVGPSKEPVEPKTISELLEFVKNRPVMYIGAKTPELLVVFLHGFYLGLNWTCDAESLVSTKRQVTEERGWDSRNTISWAEMRESGLSDKKIVDELMTIEVESWKRVEADK